jgi:hypothetical protein
LRKIVSHARAIANEGRTNGSEARKPSVRRSGTSVIITSHAIPAPSSVEPAATAAPSSIELRSGSQNSGTDNSDATTCSQARRPSGESVVQTRPASGVTTSTPSTTASPRTSRFCGERARRTARVARAAAAPMG